MTEAQSNNASSNITLIIDQVLETGQVNRQDYFQMRTLFLSDVKITAQERTSINRIFDELQMGRLTFL